MPLNPLFPVSTIIVCTLLVHWYGLGGWLCCLWFLLGICIWLFLIGVDCLGGLLLWGHFWCVLSYIWLLQILHGIFLLHHLCIPSFVVGFWCHGGWVLYHPSIVGIPFYFLHKFWFQGPSVVICLRSHRIKLMTELSVLLPYLWLISSCIC